jgi:uncharacterized Zn finger protein
MTTAEIEADLRREYLACPGCAQDVHTVAAEGVPAQALRACRGCGHVFFMNTTSRPRYTKVRPAD